MFLFLERTELEEYLKGQRTCRIMRHKLEQKDMLIIYSIII